MKASSGVTLLLVALGGLTGCSSSPTTPSSNGVLFEIRTCVGSLQSPNGELFRVLVRDPATVSEARTLIGAGVGRRIVSGRLVKGNGGFNQPWTWHQHPDTVTLVDVAAEVSDGCPSDVEKEGTSYGNGWFTPWSTEVIREL